MARGEQGDEPRFAPWRVVARREVFVVPGQISVAVEAVELPDGRRVDDYWQIKLADFVVVFAETAGGEIICLRQYRHGPRRQSLELVAGRIDGGEDPLAAARRELLEESGYVSRHWEALGAFTVSATQGIATAYLFRAAHAVAQQAPSLGRSRRRDRRAADAGPADRSTAPRRDRHRHASGGPRRGDAGSVLGLGRRSG